MERDDALRVSVIIPSYRSEATLDSVLAALSAQVVADPAREVIVVDSSGNGVGARLERAWPWVRVIALSERTPPGQARNRGAVAARGVLLAFLDADAIPEPCWLDALEEALVPGVDAVGGAVMNGTPASAWGTAGYILEFLDWRPGPPGSLRHAVSCNLLVRRTAFDRCGGFPDDMWPGEDTVLTCRLAATDGLAFAPRARVVHLNRTRRQDVLAHQRLLGRAFVVVSDRVPVPGGAVGKPRLAPVAVIARGVALIWRLGRSPWPARRVARLAPLVARGLLAWGAGIASAGGVPQEVD
jgi:GT2 family glycosyltransferase